LPLLPSPTTVHIVWARADVAMPKTAIVSSKTAFFMSLYKLVVWIRIIIHGSRLRHLPISKSACRLASSSSGKRRI